MGALGLMDNNILRTELYEAQNIQSNVAEILGTNFDERTPPLT